MARPNHDDMYILASAYLFLDDEADRKGFTEVVERIIPLETNELMNVALDNATDARDAMMELFYKKNGPDAELTEHQRHAMYQTVWSGGFIIGSNIAAGITPDVALAALSDSRNPEDYSKEERDEILQQMTNNVDNESMSYCCKQRMLRAMKANTSNLEIVLMAGLFIDGLIGGTLYVVIRDNIATTEMNTIRDAVDGINITDALLKTFT